MSRRQDHAPADRERLNRVQDIAERARLSPRQVRRLIARGELRALRIGRSVRVTEQDFLAFLARCRKREP